MKQIISIIVFALLIGVANAQTQQLTKQQLFPIYAPTMEMRSDTTAMKLLSDFNQNTVKLRAEYDERERSMSDLDFAEEVRRMKREFDMQSSIMAASVDASMKQLIKQRQLDALKAEGPKRDIKGGIQNDMNTRYGVDPSVLTDAEYSTVQEGDLKLVHDTIFRPTVLLDSKRIARDSKHEDVAMEVDNSQIEREHSSQSREKTAQSDEAVLQADNSVETGISSLKAGIIPTVAEAKETSGYNTAVHKAGKLSKEQMKAEIAKERQERKRVQDERQNDRKQARIDRKIKRRNDILIVDGEAVATNQQIQQQSSCQNNSQQNCQQNECYPYQQPQYQYDTRTATEKQYGLSGIGGFPTNQPRIMSSGRR
jgi:hypothetical protein